MRPHGPLCGVAVPVWGRHAGVGTMQDIILTLLLVGLFALGLGFAHACEGL